jgi:hypothetical protein
VTVPAPSRRQRFRALLQSLALVAAASSAAAQEARPAAEPVTADSGTSELPGPAARTNALIGGSAMVVGWYGIAAGTSLLWSDAPGADDLFIPVAGPWMALAQTGCPDTEPDCNIVELILRATLTTMSGVGQIGGLGIIGEGLFVPTRDARAASKPLELRASLQPVVGRDTLGLGVIGSF